jgi:nucleotide-binding universal stress UspA family protein
MMQSVMVVLDRAPNSKIATRLALDWGARFGARVVGLGVIGEHSMPAPEPVCLAAGTLGRSGHDPRAREAWQPTLDVLEEFCELGRAARVKTDVIEELGEPAEGILREAQRCDAVVLGREAHFRSERHHQPDTTLGVVLRHSSRPVVVVPPTWSEGQGIVVAYGGGRESTRALQTFQLLGLGGQEEIEVVSIHRDGAQAEAFTHLAGDFLSAHGARHRLHPIASRTDPVDVLLQHVNDRRPRLLVMGAHGHHPVRDLFATSVTRAVLRACPVPVFIGA